MRTLRNENGNILAVTMFVLASATMISFTIATLKESRVEDTAIWLQKKQATYLSDGFQSISNEILKSYLSKNPAATNQEMADKLRTTLQPIATNLGYNLDSSNITKVSDLPASPLPNGQFAGLLVPQRLIDFDVSISKDLPIAHSTVSSTSKISLNMYQISMFQFMTFSDLNFIDYHPGPNMKLVGRVHSNGDICLSGDSGMYIARLTSSGRVMLHGNPACQFQNRDYSNRNVYISTTGTDSNYVKMYSNGDSGCTNCQGTSVPWVNYAMNRWMGYLRDVYHSTTRVWLPYSMFAPVQMAFVEGNPADNHGGQMSDNTAKLRFLIDPVAPQWKSAARQNQIAQKADIRVLDGVWFIRDPQDPYSWPGIPIWSDHPGHATLNIPGAFELTNVGQDDIRAIWDARGMPWRRIAGVPIAPTMFSYYETNQVTGQVMNNSDGVLSYGTMLKRAITEPLVPGYLSNSQNHQICGGKFFNNGGDTRTLVGETKARCWDIPGTGLLLGTVPSSTQALLSTRGGFRNPHTQILASGTAAQRLAKSRVLPVNFDMAAFQLALANKGQGELGSYFGNTSFMQDDFNGIVYISSSWQGALNGLDVTSAKPRPVMHPDQGGTQAQNPYVNDGLLGGGGVPLAATTQVNTLDNSQQKALPINFCTSTAAGGAHPVQAGMPADGMGAFRIPLCSDYPGFLNANANAVRLVNGANLDRNLLRRGLTVASNLAVYIAGNYNTSSNPADENSVDWVSALVGGDQIVVLSNSWDDAKGSWSNAMTNFGTRDASDTKIVTAILTGWARHRDLNTGNNSFSVAANTFPSNIENWSNNTMEIWGSFVFGYYPVFTDHGTATSRQGISSYNPPTRSFNYDGHFAYMRNQPPGATLLPISSVTDFQKDSSIMTKDLSYVKAVGN